MPYIHKVQYYETDRMGITHHSNYIRWMEEARLDYLARLGWGYDRLEALGVVSPVVHVSCEFKKTTTFPDEIEIRLGVKAYRGVRLILSYEMRNAQSGELAAVGESGHCFLDEHGVPMILKKRFPDFDRVLREQAEGNGL